MKEDIEEKIIKWIGEELPMEGDNETHFANMGHAMTLTMLRNKAPSLAQSIVDMVVKKINQQALDDKIVRQIISVLKQD